MLIFQIAAGVVLGQLVFKALTETALGKWLLSGLAWVLALSVLAGIGLALWIWKEKDIRDMIDGLAFLVLFIVAIVGYAWMLWAWKFYWPRITWVQRVARLLLTAMYVTLPFGGWLAWLRPELRWPAGITGVVLLTAAASIAWEGIPNQPPPGYGHPRNTA
jgi:hypothetical protein